MADLFDDIDAVVHDSAAISSLPVDSNPAAIDPVISYPDAAGLESAPGASEFVIKCRGFPWQILEEDTNAFFAGCDISPGSFIYTWNQQGEGYALCQTAEGLRMALSKDRQLWRSALPAERQTSSSRHIDVERCDIAEYKRVRDGE